MSNTRKIKTQRATLEGLLKKPPRTREVTIRTTGDDGGDLSLTLVFRSIGNKSYDDLMTAHAPTKEQSKDGNLWNPDTFPPALISACSSDPIIDEDSASELWNSDQWSRGELMDLFFAVVKLNTEGLDIPTTEGG